MEDLERYQRQMLLPEVGEEGQKKLRNSKVLVLGCGGLGSPVLTYLAMAGVGHIVAVDADIVNITNLNRQFLYEEADVGKCKSDCAKGFIERRNPDIYVESLQIFLDAKKAEALFSDVQLVIDCVDDDKTRVMVARACGKYKIPLIEGGVSGFCAYLLPVLPGESPCIECIQPLPRPKEEAVPIIGALAGVMGSLQAMEGLKVLLGMEVQYGKLLHYDGKSGEFTSLTVHARQDCNCRLQPIMTSKVAK